MSTQTEKDEEVNTEHIKPLGNRKIDVKCLAKRKYVIPAVVINERLVGKITKRKE